MKNYNFSPSHYGAPWHLKYLLLAIMFSLGSCQKDFISDVAVSESSTAVITQQQSTDRSTNLENEVLNYTQWMLDKIVPLVKDPLVYEDLKAGNYYTARVVSKLNELGFNGYGDFAGQFEYMGSSIKEAVNSGMLSEETCRLLIRKNVAELDLTALGRGSITATTPETPCYDQLITNLAYVAVGVAIASVGGPFSAISAGVIGVATAYSAFKLCLEENYPGGGG
jgi:hypothetical protein